MALTNNLKPQVDIPVWEWCRLAPSVSSALSSTCTAENSLFHVSFGRYIYYLQSGTASGSGTGTTGFFRYDTVTDTYQLLSQPPVVPVVGSAMTFSGGRGYNTRVISSGPSTIIAAGLTGQTLKGFDIRITEGIGDGQQRTIVKVSDPIIAYTGTVTTAATSPQGTIIDANANWEINMWVGYQVRFVHASGQSQIRKIMYNTSNTLYFADIAKFAEDQFAWAPIVTIAGSTLTFSALGAAYQIESSEITVDSPWVVQPDETSRFIVRSGGIWLASSGATPVASTLQFYDIAADVWYIRNGTPITSPVTAVPTDITTQSTGENACVWDRGIALGTHSESNLQDTTKNWTVNEWVDRELRITSGTGEGKILHILSNTSNSLVFSPVASFKPYTIVADSGVINTYTVTTATATTTNCNGWSIVGTGIGADARIVSGQGTTTLVLSVANSGAVSGTLSMGISATGSNGEYTITTSIPTPQTCNGWHITGTGIGTNAFIVSGQGTVNLVLSVANSGTVSGLITANLSVVAASGTAGEYIITTNTAAPTLIDGWHISGTGIAPGATILSGEGTKTLVLSLPNIATVTGNILNLDLIPDSTSRYFIDAFEVGIVTAINPPKPINASTITATSGVVGTPNITTSGVTPTNCDGWYISGKGIPLATTVLSGQGTKSLILSANNTETVSGLLIVSPTYVSATAASGVINSYTITTSGNTPPNCNGWYIGGSGIGSGAMITSGQNTTTLTLSMINTGTVSGTLYLYPTVPNPAIATLPATTGSGGATTISTGSISAPANCNGWYISGTGIAVGAMIVSGQGTTTLTLSVANSGAVSGNPTIYTTVTTATASTGVVGTYTITTSAATPANCNGWYISGTGIAQGTTITGGQGTTTLTLSIANTSTVSGVLTLSVTALSTGTINGGVFTAGSTTGAYYPGQILLGSGVLSPATINTPIGACYTTGLSATINFTVGNPASMGIIPGMAITFLSGTTGAQSSFPTGVSVSSVTSSTVVLTTPIITAALSFATLQFGPVLYSSITATTSAGTLITVATTQYLTPGMFVSVVTAVGTGVFNVGTYITQINSLTTFTVSLAPTTALTVGAVIAFQPYQTVITGQLSGIPGGAGTYSIYPSQGTFSTGSSAPVLGIGTSVFIDNTKNWSLNRWNNQVVRIKSGTASGSARTIFGTVPGPVTYTSASLSASSSGDIINLSSGNTDGLIVGMVLSVTAGTGMFDYGTIVKKINNQTQFTVSIIPSTTLASATITGAPVNTLVTYPAWNSVPDESSRYVIHGDHDKIYESFGGIAPLFVHNIEADMLTQGRMLDYGVARGSSAQYSDYPALALSLTAPSVVVLPITSAVGYVPSSVVSAGSVTGGITTITHAGGIFPIGSWIIVAAVTPTTYNGTWQVTNSTPGSVSYYNASGTYTSGGTVLQTNSINLRGTAASGAYSAFGNGTTMTIYGCVPTAYNTTITVASGLAATPTRSMAGYQSAPGATNSTTTITVGDTTGLVAGMIPVVTSGTGAFPTGTVITSVTNGTQFVVSQAPSPSLSDNAVVSVTPSVAWVGTIPGNLMTAGFVYKVPQAVTVATRSGATCTLTTSLSLFKVGSWIHVTGITPAGYNGVHQVTASSAGSVTYVASADPGGSGTLFGTVGLATTTQLVTTINNHNFKTGQYISHQGDNGFSSANNNVTVPITTLPNTTTQYTYPVGAPSGPILNYAHQTNQLCDSTKNWIPNQWAGCMVTYNSTQITAAIPPVQPTLLSAHVVSNTNNTLIFAAAHTLPVSGVSRYVITNRAYSLSQNTIGCADSGMALGVQTAALLQDVTKSWVSPGGTVGILCTAITTATASVTVPLLNTANLYVGMTGLIMYSATGTTLAAGATINAIAPATGILTMSGNFTTTGTATMLFGYGVASATLVNTATLTTSAGLYVGMLVAVSSGSVTLPAGTTITAISANGLTITMSSSFAGTASAAVLTFTAPCSSSGKTITVSGYTTAGLAVGMYVGILSGANLSVATPTAGAFVANGGTNLTTVKVASIINATQFTVTSTPPIPLVNATVVASFWLPGMWYNRRIRLTSGSAANFLEAACTGNNHNTLFVALATPVHGSTGYSILQQPLRGVGTNVSWNFGQTDLSKRGRYLFQARGGNLIGFDRLDLSIDKWEFLTPTPSFDGLTTGAMYAYDGANRLYFTPQITQRVYYLDLDTITINGGSQYPYLAGTAIIGNRMEIYETVDNLKYLWLNRHGAQECYKQLLFY